MKKSIIFAALLAVTSLSAFELGKPCTIYYAGRNRTAAQELSKYLTAIYKNDFPVKAMKKEQTGIFVGAKKASELVASSVSSGPANSVPSFRRAK